MSISTTLRKAAQLQDKIEQLRGQLSALLVQARAEVEQAPLPFTDIPGNPGSSGGRRPAKQKRARATAAAASSSSRSVSSAGSANGRNVNRASFGSGSIAVRPGSRRRRGTSPLKGKKRNASPSGPLAPAVVRVLAEKGEPMHVRDILEGLKMANYQFTSTEPKKNLAARIYRLKGVRQVGEGLFAAM